MYEIGELVRWRCPLDADYSYGYILEITTEIHLRYIEKVKRGGGGFGRGKEHSKRSAP